MPKKQPIQCYDYVNHPYEKVRDALKNNAAEIFRAATNSAISRAETVAVGLHVNIGGIEIGKDVAITVENVEENEQKNEQKLTMSLEWSAVQTPGLFPVMEAKLATYPITGTETQLDFQGTYDPPMGILGKAVDAVVGRRIAQASVHHFVKEVAEYLRTND